MLRIFHKTFDSKDTGSLAHRFRIKRFQLFKKLFQNILYRNRVAKILDIGGTELFWKNMNIAEFENLHITLLNLSPERVSLKNMRSISGDACNLKEFSDNEFDIVFSNSVLEHLGNFSKQDLMANEVKRVCKNYFLQTPNFYFPVEPHFMFIGFHWLPASARIYLVRHFNLGWINKTPEYEKASCVINEIRLLTYKELKSLFPEASFIREKYFGLTKSFIFYKIEN